MANKPVLGIIDCPHCGRANMVEYPRCDNDRYILHVEVNSYLIPLRMTEFQMIDNCGYVECPDCETEVKLGDYEYD